MFDFFHESMGNIGSCAIRLALLVWAAMLSATAILLLFMMTGLVLLVVSPVVVTAAIIILVGLGVFVLIWGSALACMLCGLESGYAFFMSLLPKRMR